MSTDTIAKKLHEITFAAERSGESLYDEMRTIGAWLSQLADAERLGAAMQVVEHMTWLLRNKLEELDALHRNIERHCSRELHALITQD